MPVPHILITTKRKDNEDMAEEVKRLKAEYKIDPAASARRYLAVTWRISLVNTAWFICGAAFGVFLFKGADRELCTMAGEALIASGKSLGIFGIFAREAILHGFCAIVAVLSAFSLLPHVGAAIALSVYGVYVSTVACSLYSQSLPVCAAYTVTALICTLFCVLGFTQSTLFYQNNRDMGRAPSQVFTPSCLWALTKRIAPPIAHLAAASMLHASAFYLVCKFL